MIRDIDSRYLLYAAPTFYAMGAEPGGMLWFAPASEPVLVTVGRQLAVQRVEAPSPNSLLHQEDTILSGR